MEVILMERVRNLGDLGDQVKVKPGYARNYLFPKSIAIPATEENKRAFEQRRADLEQASADRLAAARARAEKLDGATIQITANVGEEGKLFGSVTPADIETAAATAGFDLAKSEIHLPEGPIKTVGDFPVEVTLHPEVEVRLIVSVVGG